MERVTTEMTDHSSAWLYVSVRGRTTCALTRCADIVVSDTDTLTPLWSNARGNVFLEPPTKCDWWEPRYALFRIQIAGHPDILLGDEIIAAKEMRAAEPGTIFYNRLNRELFMRYSDVSSSMRVFAWHMDTIEEEIRFTVHEPSLTAHVVEDTMRLSMMYDAPDSYLLK